MTSPTQLTADLVRIDSVNPTLVPGGAGEEAVARFIITWAHAQGLETHTVRDDAGRPSVVVVARGTGGGRSLMLNGHIDTVGVAGMPEPFSGRVHDGRLYGRGAFDMKSGVAACLWTAREAAREGLAGDVIVTCVADEEAASTGMQAVLREWRADAAVVTEPTHLDVCVAHKGFVWFEITTHGRAAHGSRPDLGVDAIAKMGRVLTGIERLDAELRAGAAHPMLGTGSVHASLIQGGQELSSYPHTCTLGVERRTVPGETAEHAQQQLQATLDAAARHDPDFRATLRTTLVRDPFEIHPEADIVRLMQRHAARVAGRDARLFGDTPWMDAAFLTAAGIPTVVFGPSGAGAHAVEEWVDTGSVEACADALLGVAREFCR